MERLIFEAAVGISQYAELTLIGPSGSADHAPSGCTVLEAPPGKIGFLLTSMWHILRICRKGAYDVVLGGSGLVAPLLQLAGRLSGARTAVFAHGLDVVVASRLYQALFVPALRQADLVIANSDNTRQLAIDKGVSPARIHVLHPGTNLPGPIDSDAIDEFRRKHGLVDARIVLFVGRTTRRKGLSRFICKAAAELFEQEPSAQLVIAGDNPDQGLTRDGEHQEVVNAVQALGLEARVSFLGRVSDAELGTCYAAADVHIFPLLKVPGDIEGFGMVAIEAAAYGTPTVAFSTGGVTDAVSADSGRLVEPGRYALFNEAILDILRNGKPDARQCRGHAANFSWDRFNRQLREQLTSLN